MQTRRCSLGACNPQCRPIFFAQVSSTLEKIDVFRSVPLTRALNIHYLAPYPQPPYCLAGIVQVLSLWHVLCNHVGEIYRIIQIFHYNDRQARYHNYNKDETNSSQLQILKIMCETATHGIIHNDLIENKWPTDWNQDKYSNWFLV